MRSYCRILAFVMVAFAHGQVYDDDTVMRLNISKDEGKSCSRLESTNVRNLVEQSTCQPRQRLITLQPNTSDVVLLPSQILAFRCDTDVIGSRNQVCSAISREKRTITVKASINGQGKAKCMTVDVWDHTECALTCSLTASSCKNDQIFSDISCECLCQNSETKKRECESDGKKTWNKDDCSCRCKTSHDCSSTRKWSDEICGCREK